MTSLKTFSESWHLVANLRISLKSTITVRKQYFRGELWYKFHDPFNNQFFRVRPDAYFFIMQLRRDRTIEETWNYCLRQRPESAPGQEGVIQLLSQLYASNLLHCQLPPDSVKLFERIKKRRQKEIQSKLLSIMFMRIPLFDPERILKHFQPLINLTVSYLGLIVWLSVVIFAGKLVVDRFDMAMDQFQGVLAPGNLFLLYLGMVLIKTIHEFGHAVICKRYGGEVHTMGVMFLVFTPLPYMDATSSWAFKNRWQRVLVGAGGMISEIFAAGICAIIWANTGSGTIHSLTYNMMLIASVSTVLFNINPLLRFDGYYILSDILDLPNLHQRVQSHFKHLFEKYIFGCSQSVSPAEDKKEGALLIAYGIPSLIYRVLIYVGIIFFIADKFFIAGLLLAVFCIITWGILPTVKFINYLATSPRLMKTRSRAVTVSLVFFISLFLFAALIPLPSRFRAPGIIESVDHTKVINQTAGYVQKILVPTGRDVKKGEELVKLVNQELALELRTALAQEVEIQTKTRQALKHAAADLLPLKKRMEAIKDKIADLQKKHSALIVRAKQDGTWVAPELKHLVGSWVHKGTEIGEIVNQGKFRFSAVVRQSECASLFAEKAQKTEIRIYGQGKKNIVVDNYQIIPFKQEQLPSAALGFQGGGEVATDMADEKGLKVEEPFFQIYSKIHDRSSGAELLHGVSGKIRFTMNPEPLYHQIERKIRQLFQKRYQI